MPKMCVLNLVLRWYSLICIVSSLANLLNSFSFASFPMRLQALSINVFSSLSMLSPILLGDYVLQKRDNRLTMFSNAIVSEGFPLS